MVDNPAALILCGGKGERLRPLTDEIPKPLIKIRGKPILSHLLSHISNFGDYNFVIAAGFKANVIVDFFQENHRDKSVTVIDSGDADIIERIKSCSGRLKGSFLVFYGDTLADVNLQQLKDFHDAHEAPVTVTVWPIKSSFGVLELDKDGTVINFREKPTLKESINIGFFCMDQSVIPLLDDFRKFEEFLSWLAKHKMLKGFVHSGAHLTVNTMRELEEAEEIIGSLNLV